MIGAASEVGSFQKGETVSEDKGVLKVKTFAFVDEFVVKRRESRRSHFKRVNRHYNL